MRRSTLADLPLAFIAAIARPIRVQHPARARRDRCLVAAGLLGVLLAGYLVTFDTARMTAVA